MAKLFMMNVDKFERTDSCSFNWNSELSVVLDSNGQVLYSVYATDDRTETVDFEDIKNVFGINIKEGTLSVDDDILTDISFNKINTVLSADQIVANLCSKEDGGVINFIPLSEEEFFEGTSIQKAS